MSTSFAHDFVIVPRDTLPVEAQQVAGSESRQDPSPERLSPQPGFSMTTADPRANTTVILIAPELLGTIADADPVRTTVRTTRGAARVLVRVLFPIHFEVVATLLRAGLPVEVLVAPGVEPPGDLALDPTVNVVRMPPGSRPQEVDEVALALSDVVMADRWPKDKGLPEMAAKQKKPIVAPGEELPALQVVSRDIAGRLNTVMPHWRYCFCHVFGRLEQFLLELFAFNWRGKARGGFKYSWDRLKRSFLLSWARDHGPYFAPDKGERDWRKLVPDRKAADISALIVQRFDAMDHAALHGSFLDRDLVWFVRLASAFAVFFAVAGALRSWWYGGDGVWPVTEVITLFLVGVAVFGARKAQLPAHWTSCRLAAEQLRIARLCLPLLVVPSALRGVDKPPPWAFSYTVNAMSLVKRAVRDQGLPRLSPDYSFAQGLAWLDLIVENQRDYHKDNHLRLNRAERNLHWMSTLVYFFALLGASAHFRPELDRTWLLVLTAAGPALAAALHGVVTRLGIVHRIELSQETEAELTEIHNSLKKFDTTLPPDKAWRVLREFALRASDAMGNENTSWHSLVRHEKDEV